MSAANAKVQEPSMEEILASIRRIISDDQTARDGQVAVPAAEAPPPMPEPQAFVFPEPEPVAPPAAEPPVAEAFMSSPMPTLEGDALFGGGDDVLDLAEIPDAADEQDDADLMFRDVEQDDQIDFAPEPAFEPAAIQPEPAPAPAFTMPAPDPAPAAAPEPAPADDRLLSRTTDAAVSAAFSSLAQTILTGNARTLEDLVSDMLRPMLKDWLDDNLPTIVERLVRAEIERVARGGRH